MNLDEDINSWVEYGCEWPGIKRGQVCFLTQLSAMARVIIFYRD